LVKNETSNFFAISWCLGVHRDSQSLTLGANLANNEIWPQLINCLEQEHDFGV